MQHCRSAFASLSQHYRGTAAALSQYYQSTVEALRTKTNASGAAYEYNELPEHTFRYLVLQSGSGDEPLVCTLHTSKIHDAEYEAISYVWGIEAQVHDVTCDGALMKITPNLNEALRQVRRLDKARNLWVDSICINQRDLKEKGHQVVMMGQIYQAATCVLICLDSAGSECAPGLEVLAEAASRMIDQALYHSIYSARNDSVTEGIPEDHLVSTFESVSNGSDFDYRTAVEQYLSTPRWNIFPFVEEEAAHLRGPEWHLMNTFAQKEWFDRGWVVREASLAQKAVVLWGDTELSWDTMHRISLWTGRRALKDLDMTQAVRIRCHFEAYRTQNQNFSSVFFQEVDWFEPSLLDYMGFARTLRLKDPRDRIYAFLDLGSKLAHGLNIVPNYTDTPSKVFQDFAINYIITTKDMNLLYHVMHDETSIKDISMTWVPRWDSGPENMVHFVSPSAYQPLRSRTGHVSNPAISEDNALHVQGLIFDTVCFTSSILTGSYSTSTNVPLTIVSGSLTQMTFDVWLQVRALKLSNNPYRGKLLEAFFDALATGSFYYGDLATLRSKQWKFIDLFRRLTYQMDLTGYIPWDSVDLSNFDSSSFLRQVAVELGGKRFVVTHRGYIGYGPPITRKEDLCAIIFGCHRPCLLRAASRGGSYRFVGSSFLLGNRVDTLEGEERFVRTFGDDSSRDYQDWDVEEQDICLV